MSMTEDKDEWESQHTDLDVFLEHKALDESEKNLDATLVQHSGFDGGFAKMYSANQVILDALRTNPNGFFVESARQNMSADPMSFHGAYIQPPPRTDIELTIRVSDPMLVGKIAHAMQGYYS